MMDNRFHLKFIAVFLMLLTIILPIEFSMLVRAYSPQWGPGASYSGSSTGEYVAIRTIQGLDGVPGFRRRVDSVSIAVQASLGDNVTVHPQNLVAYFSGYALGTFQQCSLVDPSASIYECLFSQGNDTGPATPSVQTYEVRLIDGTEVVGMTSSVLVVDAQAPSIINFRPSSTLTADENIKVNFQVKDYAFGTTGGVGIRTATITANGQVQYRFPEGNTSSDMEGYYDALNAIDLLTKNDVPISLGSESGTYPICLRAEDYFGQHTTQCIDVVLDLDAPYILTNTFEVRDSDGKTVRWLGEEEKSLNVYMEFQADDLDVNSIYGDFSDLHTRGINRNVKPDCRSMQNNTYGCVFGINARINQSRSYTFSFYASDVLGNTANSHVSYQLNFDNTGPVPNLLTTPKYYNGIYFIGKEPLNLTVRFLEEGSGMNNTEAYIDLSSIGMGGRVQAYNCTPGWNCVWTDVNAVSSAISDLDNMVLTETINGTEVLYEVNAKQATVRVLSETQDYLGNPAEAKTFNLSVDIYDPVINDYNVTSVSSDAFFEGHTVVGDGIYIRFNISDATFITMNITADDFVTESEGFQDSYICQDNYDGTHLCEYVFGPITKEGYYQGELKLVFYDLLGNSVTHVEKIDVLEIMEEEPNFWTGSNAGCSPDPLDRHYVDRMPSDIYCRANLRSNQNVEIYDMVGGSCTSSTGSGNPVQGAAVAEQDSAGNNLISNSNWMGLARNDPGNVYINFVTRTFEPRIDSFDAKCGLKVRSVVDGKRITALYEEVEVDFSVGLFNTPLGEVDQEVWNKINKIYGTYVKDGWKLIGQLNDFFEFMGKLCRLAQVIMNILRGFFNLGQIFSFSGSALAQTVYLKPPGENLHQVGNYLDHGGKSLHKRFTDSIYDPYLQTACNFVSCRLAIEWPKWAGAVQNRVNAYLEWSSDLGVGTWIESGFRESATINPFEHIPEDYRRRDAQFDARRQARNPEDDDDNTQAFKDWYMNSTQISAQGVKDSWILSIATLCIPGMIYNANKYREIQCTYGSCLLSSADSGLPSSFCEENKAYAECRFIFGPLFELIPFAGFLENIMQSVANIVADWRLIIDIGVDFACNSQYASKRATNAEFSLPWTIAAYVCVVYDTAKLYTEIASSIEAMTETDYWSYSGTGACDTFEDAYKKLKSGPSPPDSAET